MKTEKELENCLESFERRTRIEQNPETKKMWLILKMYTEFLLDRRGHMYYPGYGIDSNHDIDPRPARAQESE